MTSVAIEADDNQFPASTEGASIQPTVTMHRRGGGTYYLFINPITGRPTNLTIIIVGVILLWIVYVTHYRGKADDMANPKLTKLGDDVPVYEESRKDKDTPFDHVDRKVGFNPDLIPFPHLVHQQQRSGAGGDNVVIPGGLGNIGGVPHGNNLVPVARQNIPRPKPKEFPVEVLLTPELNAAKCPVITYILLVVTSLPIEATLRNSIRRTWGNPNNFGELKITGLTWRVVFALGTGSSEIDDEKIVRENEKYGDIIQGKFDDTGVEDTRKSMMVFKWITEVLSKHAGCRPAFVLKTPAKVYIHIPYVLDWTAHKVKDMQNVYRGKLLRKDLPIRVKEDPLYIPPEDFAGDTFPDIIRNPVYFFSTDVIEGMVQRFGKITPIAMEDSYLGLLANDMGVKPTNDDNFLLMQRPRNICHYKKMMFVFDVTPAEQVHVFNVVERGHMGETCRDDRGGL